MDNTANLLSCEDDLRRLTDDGTFERGRAYWGNGRVGSLRADGGGVVAIVSGESDNRVRLWRQNSDFAWSCTCPVGETGALCKHAVALGLAVLDGADSRDGDALPTLDDLRAWLIGKDTTELAEMVLAQAREDERLLQRLTLRVLRERGAAVDLGAWRRTLDDTIRHNGFIGYREAHAYADGIDDALDGLDDLLADGHAGAVVELADHAFDELSEAINDVDDSNGHIGGLLHRLKDLHRAACGRCSPDPVDLARSLIDRELADDWGVFAGTVTEYADVLGEAGLAAFRRLAEAEWAKVPARGPGDDTAGRYGRRSRLRSIMLTLAADADDKIAVMARDLSMPHDFLEIAEFCRRAERWDAALDWAERGWNAFAGQRPDERLRAFLADALLDRGRHDDAMALAWDGFTVAPGFGPYKTLKGLADRCGQWAGWRDKALARIRERIAGNRRKGADRNAHLHPWMGADHSDLVDIFLWEGDASAAWGEARAGGCSHHHWLRLADARAETHPEDALAVYREQMPVVLPETGSGQYERAIEFLHQIHGLLIRLGRTGEFTSIAADYRLRYRRKRNFVKLLDREGW